MHLPCAQLSEFISLFMTPIIAYVMNKAVSLISQQANSVCSCSTDMTETYNFEIIRKNVKSIT